MRLRVLGCYGAELPGFRTIGPNTFVYTGDTGLDNGIWEEAAREPNLRFVITEVSFPNRMQGVANLTKHMTPNDLSKAVKKIGKTRLRIYVMHMKPQYIDVIKGEVAEVAAGHSLSPYISILTPGEVIEF